MDNSKSVLLKIANLYAEQLMSDLTLEVAGVGYPAHRLILCASSEVFQVSLYLYLIIVSSVWFSYILDLVQLLRNHFIISTCWSSSTRVRQYYSECVVQQSNILLDKYWNFSLGCQWNTFNIVSQTKIIIICIMYFTLCGNRIQIDNPCSDIINVPHMNLIYLSHVFVYAQSIILFNLSLFLIFFFM